MNTPRHNFPTGQARWVFVALILGLMVFRWWQPLPEVRKANGPATVFEDRSSNESAAKSNPTRNAATTGESPVHVTESDRNISSAKPVSADVSQPIAPQNKTGPPRVDGFRVENVIVKSLDGDVVFRGTVDLTKTLARIDEKRVLSEFRNDGVEFKNLERRLPNKPRGHYREWVHSTAGLRGPGPQRVVTGKQGEAFYTWDHYDHFVRIRSGQ